MHQLIVTSCVSAEEAAAGVVGVRGVRAEVQSDVAPESSPSDSRCRKRRHRHVVPAASACQYHHGAALFRVREEVLLSDPPPEPHPDPALNRTWTRHDGAGHLGGTGNRKGINRVQVRTIRREDPQTRTRDQNQNPLKGHIRIWFGPEETKQTVRRRDRLQTLRQICFYFEMEQEVDSIWLISLPVD